MLLTNYHRYVDQFVAWALAALRRPGGAYSQLALPGVRHRAARSPEEADDAGDCGVAVASLPDAGL